MNTRIFKHTLIGCLLFSAFLSYGQKSFDLKSRRTSFSIEDTKLYGYQTSFDFPKAEVRKGWWKYARKFGNPTDMRTYYVIKIPAETNDGNIDISLYSQTESEGLDVTFKLGIEDRKYENQVNKILFEFKRTFYINYYLEQIDELQSQAASLSARYEAETDQNKKHDLLLNITNKQLEIDNLLTKVKGIEKQNN